MTALHFKMALGIAAIIGLLNFIRAWFGALASGSSRSPLALAFDEFGAALFAVALLLPVIRLTLTHPPWRWPHWLIYIPIALLFAGCHTLLMYLSRTLLYPVFGFGPYDYGDLSYRFIMEAPVQLMIFFAVMAVMFLLHQSERARQADRLRAQLASAHLERLRLQLAPHFLFNTLNTISATVYESAQRADDLIGRLGEMLRRIIAADAHSMTTLDDEIEMLEQYIAIQSARFEQPVQLTVNSPADHAGSTLPSMILQPLVENVFKHAQDRQGHIDMRLSSRLEGGDLLLCLSDRGACPVNPETLTEGIGLQNVRERLALMYAEEASFDIAPNSQDTEGSTVMLRIPQ